MNLKKALERALLCTEKVGVRPPLQNILFECYNGKLYIVGCDGQQMAVTQVNCDEEDFAFCVYNGKAKELVKELKADTSLEGFLSRSNEYSHDGLTFPWKRVFETTLKEKFTEITLSSYVVQHIIDYNKTIEARNTFFQNTFRVEKGFMHYSIKGLNVISRIVEQNGPDCVVFLDGSKLKRIFQTMSNKTELTMQFTATNPAHFSFGNDKEHFTYLLMPMSRQV